jgi:integrase
MPAYRDRRSGAWRYRKRVRMPDGSRPRIEGTPALNTKLAAEQAERAHIERLLRGERDEPKKEVPTFAEFAKTFMATYARSNNKPSECEAKRSILNRHLLPAFGSRRLGEITGKDVEDLKARLLDTKRSAKRINNVLNVLSKILRYAVEIELLERVPRIKTLKVPPQKFDFFTFEELEALVAKSADESEWHAAVLVAGDAGLRLGEMLALEWTDIDFKNRLLTVMRNDWRGSIGAPKSGRDRKIPLTTRLMAALKATRHLKGKLVFCWDDGSRWTNSTMRAGLKRQQKRAGLRVTGWHVLRHTFCSHLAMRGAPAIAIKELAGHSSIAVTNRYMHLAPGGAARNAIELLEAGRQMGDNAQNLA